MAKVWMSKMRFDNFAVVGDDDVVDVPDNNNNYDNDNDDIDLRCLSSDRSTKRIPVFRR
jgi:hypothetical protein